MSAASMDRKHARYDFIGTLQVGWSAMLRHGVRGAPLDAARVIWTAMLRHSEERRTLVALSRLPEHVIRDMGLDPEAIYKALEGTWDEFDPAHYRSHLPRRDRL